MSKHAVVRGFVVDRTSGLGIVGARVEAWDASKQLRDLVAYARSGEGGAFTMELSPEQQKALFGDSTAVLSFRVFDGTTKNLLLDGARSDLWRIDGRATEVTLRVSPGRPLISVPRHAVAVVKGQVSGASGPLANLVVQAYDENLGVLTALGAPATTDATGSYRVTYDPATIPNGKHRPDLVVKAFSSLSPPVEVAVSATVFRAPALATVNVVPRGERWQGKVGFNAVYDQITALSGGGSLGALDSSQRASLARSAGLPQRDVDAISFAAKLQTDFSVLSHEVAFGLVRRGLPGDADSFFAHPKSVIREELRGAIDDNLIAQTHATQIESVLSSQWVPAAAAWALQPRTGEVCGLSEVLEAAQVTTPAARQAFAEEYCAHEGKPSDFWDNLTSLDATQKGRVQLALQHWSLTRGHKPLLDHLSQLHETYPTLESLVTVVDWPGFLSQAGIGAPASIPGATTAEKQASYANLLAFTISQAFPMKTFLQRVTPADDPEIHDFFASHSNFEFGKDRLTKDAPMASARVRAYERIYKVIPRYEPVKTLVDAGYRSAHDIVQKGKDRFVSEMAVPLGGQDTARATWNKALWQASASSVVFAKYAAALHKVSVAALPDFFLTFQPDGQFENGAPDWTSLFGSPGGCACRHCASVLSASAYLVDLLQWLDGFTSEQDRPGGGQWSALDILIGSEAPNPLLPGRRPDLKRLELTCKAANTPLPYIDLVNEILEVAVAARANAGVPDTSLSVATTYDAGDLLAGPEILATNAAAHAGAWSAVNHAVYPFTLPVDLWAEETNAYLRYLGVSRPEIVETLAFSNSDLLAKSWLGVRASGYQLLQTSPAGGPPLEMAWGGFEEVGDLAPVPVFLQRAGLSFEELEELLSTRYVNGLSGNGAGTLGVLSLSPPNGCDPAQMTLTAVSADDLAGHLSRLHPFLRLVRRTGLSITEVDRILAAFAGSQDNIVIDALMLQKLTQTRALAERLSLPISDVLSFYGPLDRWEKYTATSPFRRAFLDRTVDRPEVLEFKAILETGSGAGTIAEHRLTFQRTLAISAGDFDLLTSSTALAEVLSLPASEVVAAGDALITHEDVSRLYAAVTLARALRLPLRDFLVLRALAGSGAEPFSCSPARLASPRTTVELCRLVDDLRSGPMSVAEIQYVLRAVAPATGGLGPAAAAIEALRSDLVKSVDLVVAETETSEDVDGARTRALLNELVPAEAAGLFDAIRQGNAAGVSVSSIVPYFPDPEMLNRDVAPSETHVPAALASSAERFSLVARWLERHVRCQRSLVEKLAATHHLPVATMQHLLTSVIESSATPGRPAILDFLPARRGDDLGGGNHATEWQSATLLLLDRHARLLGKLGVADPIPAGPDGTPAADLGEVLWVYPSSAPTPGLHDLPRDASGAFSDTRARFSWLRTLIRRMGLKARLAGGPDALRRILTEIPNSAQPTVLLAELTGWERATIDELSSVLVVLGQNNTVVEDGLFRLERAVRLCSRLGMSAADARKLLEIDHVNEAAAPTAADQVALARRAAKAKVSSTEWAEVARRVRDPFREKLRDALLGYLVPRYYSSASVVYATLLIDPEMSPSQLTSRVVQATNSVQVFVQRSLLGLDAAVKLPATAGKEWEWRKSYRVWEANRKVFLYPENWLDPALRDGKTPLFKEMETRLAQGELTDEAVEGALSQYLNGLSQIAHLQTMAMCDETDEDGDLVATHVVARTRSAPYRWFHRRRTPLSGWLPWEPMSLDIEADGVLLTVQNRRLHLFWPVLTVRPREKQTPAPQDSKETVLPVQCMEIRIAYSVHEGGAFSGRRLSTSPPLVIEPARGEDSTTGISQQDISLVVAPSAQLAEGQIGVDVLVYHVVRTEDAMVPEAPSGASDFEESQQDIAGRFILDPCGPRWTTQSRITSFDADQIFSFADDYAVPLPPGGTIERDGIHVSNEQTGPVMVPRPGFGLSASPIEILAGRPGNYRLVAESSSRPPFVRYFHFVFEDQRRSFFVRIERDTTVDWHFPNRIGAGQHAGPSGRPGSEHGIAGALWDWSNSKQMAAPSGSFHLTDTPIVEAFEHPRVCEMARRLASRGIAGLLGWKQTHEESVQFSPQDLSSEYGGSDVPKEGVDFAYGGAYSAYNWELFFHLPVLVASRLSAEGRYEAAQKWLHFVFDPTGGPSVAGARRHWRFRPFYENHDLASIQKELSTLAESSSTAAEIKALVSTSETAQSIVASLQQQIAALVADPFNPHAIARHRTLAYQKAAVMQYIDNLLDWGDSLFRRDTLESMHEALSVYLLAADLLGPRPVTLTHKDDPVGKTFDQLRTLGLDEFGNAALSVESIVPATPAGGWKISFEGPPPPDARLYFCVPGNDVLVGYWDRVSDRLFKLRNGMSIDGVVRQLPLFSPPIDPAILVRAAAAGVSLDKVLDALAAPAPLFRFLRLHAKAVEFASHVASLGQSLLAAIEKRDGEDLGRLRQTHERNVLDAEREVRKGAVAEARQTLEGLQRQRLVVARREEHYRTIEHRIDLENMAQQDTYQALRLRKEASQLELMAEFVSKIPQFTSGGAGAAGSPFTGMEVGGQTVALGISSVAREKRDSSDSLVTGASQLQTEAGYLRRSDEWKLQADLAKRELSQIDKQIAAQEIRVALAEREVENLDLRRSQARDIEDVLRTKFSNTELYDWMKSEVAAEHYRAYQVAYDMAKKAERAYQLERGDDNATFIRFGAWDSLKRGLLAGERLLADLRALDAAYLSRTDREREITKHVSLAELAHAEGTGSYLVQLRDTGTADNIEIPEWLFDADYPGHYFRRLKAVSVSVATVRSSLDGVQCELTLLGSRVRKTASLQNGYQDAAHTIVSTQVIKALSTSTADDDAGLFQLDLRDEKLLPYEGQGAVSTWRVDVRREQNRFPLHRISDVVLHLRYTARDAGEAFRTAALGHASGPDANGQGNPARRVRTISARAEAPEAWARFLAGQANPTKNRLELPLSQAGFLSFFGSSDVKIVGLTVSATFSRKYDPPASDTESLPFELTLPDNQHLTGKSLGFRGGEPCCVLSSAAVTPDFAAFVVPTAPTTLVLEVLETQDNPIAGAIRAENGLIEPDALEDLWLTFAYEEVVP